MRADAMSGLSAGVMLVGMLAEVYVILVTGTMIDSEFIRKVVCAVELLSGV